jgi:hypothetical protein
MTMSQKQIKLLGQALIAPLLFITLASSSRLILQRWNVIPTLREMYTQKDRFKDFKMDEFTYLNDEDGLLPDDHYNLHPRIAFLHIYAAWMWSLLGFFQLTNWIQIGWHRTLGTMFFTCSLLLGMTSFMMIPANIPYSLPFSSPWSLYYPLLLSGVWFLYTVSRAWQHISKRQVLQHRIWTIRHVSCGMGVSLMRWIQFVIGASCTSALNKTHFLQRFMTPWMMDVCSRGMDVETKKKTFVFSAWLGFVLTPLIAEIGLRLWLKKGKAQ